MLVNRAFVSALLLGAASASAVDLSKSDGVAGLSNTDEAVGLSKRDEAVRLGLEKREQKITVSHCTGCTVTPGGGTSCINNWYIHWGDSKLGSCNDSSFLYNDSSCTGTIPTPSGTGTFSPSNCGAGQDQQFATINANGNTYTCYKAAGNFSVFCGVNYSCYAYASCYGP